MIIRFDGFLHSLNIITPIFSFCFHLPFWIISWIIRRICFILIHIFHLFCYSIIISWLHIIAAIIFTVFIFVLIFIINIIGINFSESFSLGRIISHYIDDRLHTCDINTCLYYFTVSVIKFDWSYVVELTCINRLGV